MERDEKSCIETKVGRFRGLGTGMLAFVFPVFDRGRKVGRGGRLRFEGYDASRFIFTDYRTLDDCKLECNSSSASVDLSSVSGPPLSAMIHSVLTSVVLPVSAFVELFRWPIARIFSITILLSFYESPLPPPPLHRAASFGQSVIGFVIRSESRLGRGLRENKIYIICIRSRLNQPLFVILLFPDLLPD